MSAKDIAFAQWYVVQPLNMQICSSCSWFKKKNPTEFNLCVIFIFGLYKHNPKLIWLKSDDCNPSDTVSAARIE